MTYKAILLEHVKNFTEEGDIIESNIWRVRKSLNYPEGIKYSFVYIHKDTRLIGFDNHEGKGHHKHLYDKETKQEFTHLSEIKNLFRTEVMKLRYELYKK